MAADAVEARARRWGQSALEQSPKPGCRGGFVAVMGLSKSFIKAGHRPEDLERAIRSGVFTTWTLAAMTAAWNSWAFTADRPRG